MDNENKPLYFIFIDYSKAFDIVDDARLFYSILNMTTLRHVVELIAGLYNNEEAAVRRNGQLTKGCLHSRVEQRAATSHQQTST